MPIIHGRVLNREQAELSAVLEKSCRSLVRGRRKFAYWKIRQRNMGFGFVMVDQGWTRKKQRQYRERMSAIEYEQAKARITRKLSLSGGNPAVAADLRYHGGHYDG